MEISGLFKEIYSNIYFYRTKFSAQNELPGMRIYDIFRDAGSDDEILPFWVRKSTE